MANIFKSKYTGEQIEEILDKANNVTDVQANNGEPTTADLSTLKIGDVNYKIPEPSAPTESTDVEANPTAEATAVLSKLRVGTEIYSIPSGNGGSGDFVTLKLVYRNHSTKTFKLKIDEEKSLSSLLDENPLLFWGNTSYALSFFNVYLVYDGTGKFATREFQFRNAGTFGCTSNGNAESVSVNGVAISNAVYQRVKAGDVVEIIYATYSTGSGEN